MENVDFIGHKVCAKGIRYHDNPFNGFRVVSFVKTDSRTSRRNDFKRSPTGLRNRAVTRARQARHLLRGAKLTGEEKITFLYF